MTIHRYYLADEASLELHSDDIEYDGVGTTREPHYRLQLRIVNCEPISTEEFAKMQQLVPKHVELRLNGDGDRIKVSSTTAVWGWGEAIMLANPIAKVFANVATAAARTEELTESQRPKAKKTAKQRRGEYVHGGGRTSGKKQ